MSRASIKLSDEVRDVLESATFILDEAGYGHMTFPQTLHYAKVKKFLEYLHAQWIPKLKHHTWHPDAQEKYDELLVAGNFIDKKKLHQQYFTPDDLAKRLFRRHFDLDDFSDETQCLEPSAGNGALVRVLKERFANVTAVETDEQYVNTLTKLGAQVYCQDFLQLQPVAMADLIYMNPPFTGGQDIKHVQHAFRFLKPNGQLFAIMSRSALLPKHVRFTSLCDAFGQQLEQIPSGAFKESGTEVPTVFIKLTYPDF